MPHANGPEKRSGLECKAERHWSGISGGYDVEFWPFGVLSLQPIPRVQNPTISVRAGEDILGEVKVTRSPVSPADKTQHNNNDSRHNVNNHLDISVPPQLGVLVTPSTSESRYSQGRTRRLGIGKRIAADNKIRVGLNQLNRLHSGEPKQGKDSHVKPRETFLRFGGSCSLEPLT